MTGPRPPSKLPEQSEDSDLGLPLSLFCHTGSGTSTTLIQDIAPAKNVSSKHMLTNTFKEQLNYTVSRMHFYSGTWVLPGRKKKQGINLNKLKSVHNSVRTEPGLVLLLLLKEYRFLGDEFH